MTEREPGPYHIKWWPDTEWVVALWAAGQWWAFGTAEMPPNDPAVIGPRITPPEGGKDG